MRYEYAIVGAGLCGLALARALTDAGREVIVLEKSRGVGGRMATRRTERGKFDHGAQLYTVRPEIASLDERWREAGLVEAWGPDDTAPRKMAKGGMTSLAKNLAEGLRVELSQRVTKLSPAEGLWKLGLEAGAEVEAKSVIVTAPLPQALDLLRASGLPYDGDLDRVPYAKALVGLFEGVRSGAMLNRGFRENVSADIYSVADQAAKGFSAVPAWVVVATPEFSEREFEADDDSGLARLIAAVRAIDPAFTYETAQLKKWRYSHPLRRAVGEYREAAAGLFLAGDAFGRPSMNGAAASAAALAARFLEPAG